MTVFSLVNIKVIIVNFWQLRLLLFLKFLGLKPSFRYPKNMPEMIQNYHNQVSISAQNLFRKWIKNDTLCSELNKI